MSRASRKSTAGGKKKVKPISFEEDEDVETMFMAEVPIVTASLMPSMSNNNMRDPAAKKKSKYFGNDEGVESPEEEDEDEMDNKSVSKFLQKSPSKAKSKNQGHNSSSGNLMASGAAPPNLGREPSLVSSNFQPVKPWPPALRNKIAHSLKGKQNEAGCREFLTRHLWPTGLKEAIIKSCRKLPLRFFIVDDSGSMILNDGRRLVSQGTTARLVKCTRWAELSESMTFMAELSSALGIPSEFRLLNGAEPIIVGLSDDQGESMRFLREVMAESPAGPTPLCMHITGVVQSILSIEKELRANQQKAVVVIATDGESSDGNVAEALRPLTDVSVSQ